ncbi:MAG: hypothetical protein IPM85_07525 [Chitinophagaceae bacterium]|nr:hypothetical protein [Chitinophagaceae bacterium]
MGYPVHGDVQSGVWNPIVILMSLIRKYDIYWLQIETIIAIIIAGISMYHLLTYLKINRKVVLLVSAAYMLNGFIADSGQFINWICALHFLPFCISIGITMFQQIFYQILISTWIVTLSDVCMRLPGRLYIALLFALSFCAYLFFYNK